MKFDDELQKLAKNVLASMQDCAQTCPYCNNTFTKMSDFSSETVKPQPNDLSVCYKCHGFLQFDNDLKLVKVDLESLDADALMMLSKSVQQIDKIKKAKEDYERSRTQR